MYIIEQEVNIKVVEKNIIISVIDIGDARSSWTFKAEIKHINLL